MSPELLGVAIIGAGFAGIGMTIRLKLHDRLEHLRSLVVEQVPFDPGTATNTSRIAASDFVHRALMLPAGLAVVHTP